MREILFRGISKETGEWVYGTYSKDYPDTKRHMIIRFDVHGEYGGLRYETVVPESVGQFTGITDIKGNKVFEGDVHQIFDGRLVKVEWNTAQLRWSLMYLDTDDICCQLDEGEDFKIHGRYFPNNS